MIERTLLEVRPYDTANYLTTDELIQGYLNDVLADGDEQEFLEALHTVARAHGMAKVAQAAGIAPKTLSHALSSTGNPEFHTLWKILSALGCRLRIDVVTTPAESATTDGLAVNQ